MAGAEFQRYSLPNGVTLVAERHANVRGVAIGVWMKVGSAFESKQTNGINHFLEHMLFKGTTTRSPLDIVIELEKHGGELNAFTDREHTVFHACILKEQLDIALDILSDLLKNAVFPKVELGRERKVLLQEMAMAADDPDEYISDTFANLVWEGEPLGIPVIGNKKVIQAMTRRRLEKYYKDYYRPENMVISVAGNFEFSALKEKVEKYFTFKTAQKTLPLKIRDTKYRSRRKSLVENSDQMHLMIGFEGMGYHAPARYDALVLNYILGGGMSSRLFQEIREKSGLAYGVDTDFYSYMSAGLFTIYMSIAYRSMKKCLEILGRELEDLKKNPVSKEELDSFVGQITGSILMSSDQMETRQESLGRNECVFGRYVSVEEVIARLEEVTPEGVQAVAQKMFCHEKESMVTLGRKKFKAKQLTVFK